MPATPLHIVSLVALTDEMAAALEASPFGPFTLHACTDRAQALARLASEECDVLLLASGQGDDADAQQVLAYAAGDTAAVVAGPPVEPAAMLAWLERGAQDVVSLATGESGVEAASAFASALAPRLRAAIERKRLERDARKAYATDLETGLPHQQQLIEHMSQLLALREREPAPMAVLALRVEGLATTEARLGRESANVLRRKVGVRLRAGVRASDVVASLGDDSFAVLLGSILAPADADRVGAKLLKALMQPFMISGSDVAVAVALGIGQYPQDGAQPEALLRRAVSLAAAAPAQGREGLSNFMEAGGRSPGAANDD
ncbi:hypothetical protein BH11PSE9_BH11PSE9_29760 [soil metagenome]